MMTNPYFIGVSIGIAFAAFVHFAFDRRILADLQETYAEREMAGELKDKDKWRFKLLQASVRFVTPALIIAVFGFYAGPMLFGDAS